MKETIKEKLMLVRDFILARGKIVFPILLVAAVAVTVTVALNAGAEKQTPGESPEASPMAVSGDDALTVSGNIPLELNAHEDINELVLSYYQAKADGDAAAVEQIQKSMDDMERIKIEEMSKYIESYPTVEVYTKPGPEENSYIVIAYTRTILSYYPEDYYPGYETFYVCTDENGELYFNKGIVDESVSEYIRQVVMQDDVVELYNKITVEYNDICIAKPELYQYLSLIEQQVQSAAAVTLAQQIVNDEGSVSDGNSEGGQDGNTNPDGTTDPEVPVEPAGPIYATATATVNVRSSDSVTADKLGQVKEGTKVEVLEQFPNGWSKIVFERKEGFIKSEFLTIAESANNVQVIGSITVNENVNVRMEASQTSGKLGVATGGTKLDLVAKEGEWCKVVYEGQIGYVKAEFVTVN